MMGKHVGTREGWPLNGWRPDVACDCGPEVLICSLGNVPVSAEPVISHMLVSGQRDGRMFR